MIKLLKKGRYHIFITPERKTILNLDGQCYYLEYAPTIGDLLMFSKHPHKQSYILSQGNFKLYDVEDEPKLVDLNHLELSVGLNQWQGYLLLTGLPTAKKTRSRIVPTEEIITKERG